MCLSVEWEIPSDMSSVEWEIPCDVSVCGMGDPF